MKPLAWYVEAARSRIGSMRPDDADDAEYWDGLTAAAEALAGREGDVERFRALAYVPGAWRCPKCGLRLIASTLSVQDGGMYANNEPHACANGCGPMWRVTEREDRQEAQRFAIEQSEKLTTPSRAGGGEAGEALERAAIEIENGHQWITAVAAATIIRKQATSGSAAFQWQPMETAPRDGTLILGWFDNPRWPSAPGILQWTDHNGGGWTHYANGKPVAWTPMPRGPSAALHGAGARGGSDADPA